MQTEVCVRQKSRFLHSGGGVPAPATLTNPARVGCRERIAVQSRQGGRDPLPLTPSQPSAVWMPREALRPHTPDNGRRPLDPEAFNL